MEERWSADQVLALTPDAASRKAGTKLAAPGPWSRAGTATLPDGAGTAVWGLCKGSGAKPYQTIVDITTVAYTCSCPSRKFPCKHCLGLLLLWSASHTDITERSAPDWVTEWFSARRARAADKAAKAARTTADPIAAQRRAERRARRVADGVAELEQRLADQVRAGFAGADQDGYRHWDEVAARMVDAQAPGLAARVRELAAIPASGDGWPSRLLEEYALLHLLGTGYLTVDRLPEPLAATVRSRVGFTLDSAELLRGPTIRDHWWVLGQDDTTNDRLCTRRIWLLGRTTGRVALLMSFGAGGRTPDLALPTAVTIEADVAFHPAAQPLRAVLGERRGVPAAVGPPFGVSVGAAVDRYGQALAADPWLDAWPVVLGEVIPIPSAHGWRLTDAAPGGHSLPIRTPLANQAGLWRLAAVSGGHPVTVFGECGHQGFSPHTVWGAPDPARGVAL